MALPHLGQRQFEKLKIESKLTTHEKGRENSTFKWNFLPQTWKISLCILVPDYPLCSQTITFTR